MRTLALAAFAALIFSTLPASADCVYHDGVCHSSVALARQYGYVPPPATAGVYAQVGVRTGGAYAGPRNGPRRALTPEQKRQLDELLDVKAEEVLGERPANSRGFIGDKPQHQPVRRGCHEKKVPNYETRRMFVRVVCP